jgi:hypothetical protein
MVPAASSTTAPSFMVSTIARHTLPASAGAKARGTIAGGGTFASTRESLTLRPVRFPPFGSERPVVVRFLPMPE